MNAAVEGVARHSGRKDRRVLTAVWTAQHPHTSYRSQWGLRPPGLELWEAKDPASRREKERKGGGKNSRLKVRVHTDTKSYVRGKREGGVKPGKGAWETYRGAQVHKCPAGAVNGSQPPSLSLTYTHLQKPVIIYSKSTFTFLTRWDTFFFWWGGGGSKSQWWQSFNLRGSFLT